MVSRRNYLSVLIVFAITLFLYIFSVFTMDFGRNVDENIYIYGDNATSDTEFTNPDSITSVTDNMFVLYFGKDSDTKNTAEEWSRYIKLPFFAYDSFDKYTDKRNPAMVLVSGKDFNKKDIEAVKGFTEKSIPVVFMNLPEIDKLKEDTSLRELLGISSIRNESMEIEGIQFYKGFLLGGEAYYRTGDMDNERELYDLPEEMPWIVTLTGTKTFGVGVLEKYLQEYENKETQYPPVIWRNTNGNGYIYTVNGDYMSDITGLGFLTSIYYDSKNILVYPVVNSKIISVTDFPNLSDENREAALEKYNRDVPTTMKELILPGLASIANNGINRITAFVNTGYEAKGNSIIQKSDYNFYQEQLSNVRSEMGVSMNYDGSVDLNSKISRDDGIFDYLDTGYEYNAAFIANEQRQDIEALLKGQYYRNISTFVSELENGKKLFEYIDEDITSIRTTSNLRDFKYSDDLRLRSVMTALGYSNTLMEVNPAIWDDNKENEWQLIYDDASNHLSNYFYKYKDFESTTASIADQRIRNFLGISYDYRLDGNTLHLNVSSFLNESFFILRTTDKKIKKIDGGKATLLESGVYLIRTEAPEITIEFVGEKKGLRF